MILFAKLAKGPKVTKGRSASLGFDLDQYMKDITAARLRPGKLQFPARC